MATLISENAKRIRKQLEVFCGISSRDAEIDLSLSSYSGDVAVVDYNISASLDSDWDVRSIADLANGGFILDGTTSWYDPNVDASESAGKLGIRTDINGTVVITVTATAKVPAVTLDFTAGTGVVLKGTTEYPAGRQTVIPINATSATLTITAQEDTRLVLGAVTPGITLNFDNSNLISCTLDLCADLSPVNQTVPISSIEINAYLPQGEQVEKVLANMQDGTPIWYYAGYPGDYSTIRHFYLSEPATVEGKRLTLKGEDAAAKLARYEIKEQTLMVTAPTARAQIYNKMKSVIKAAGIKLVSSHTAPGKIGTSKNVRPQVYTTQYARDIVARIMQLCHFANISDDLGAFYPRFIDAGIPRLKWREPVNLWTINEADCGEVQRSYDRTVGKLKTKDRYGVRTQLAKKTKKTKFSEMTYEKNDISTYNFDGCFAAGVSVSNASIIEKGPSHVTFKAKADGKCKITGYKIYAASTSKSITANKAGVDTDIEPKIIGYCNACDRNGTLHELFPVYKRMANISTTAGTFVWRGDPHMQPRDVFTFVRLDGTEEVCTIESIILTHENGGTRATINYRKGVC